MESFLREVEGRAEAATLGPFLSEDVGTQNEDADFWIAARMDIPRLISIIRASGDNWQPIETAPKDEKNILLYDADLGVVRGYCDSEGDWFAGVWIQPTHWMPLPAPPVEKK